MADQERGSDKREDASSQAEAQQSLTGGAGFERGYDLVDDSVPEVVNLAPDQPDDEPPINPFEDDEA